ncbi:MAG TPA: alkaline phosphatase family protein, partial [Anaerolineae bacterium]|nr:alkaline phosphatase family protein [Anaerolineae bacterium]
TFERLSNQGKLPHLTRYIQIGGYSRFGVANPSQSEVSWTSIATGLNPGGHGIFDFVHRNPATYSPYVSLLPVKKTLGGTQFAPPFDARTIFDQVASQGYPATAMWWPALFPARLASPVRTIPGLGTPDIQGKLGVGTLFTTELSEPTQVGKTPHEPLRTVGKDRFAGKLKGPKQQTRGGFTEAEVEFNLEIGDESSARLRVGSNTLTLKLGGWSPIFEVSFKLGRFISIQTITRVILTQLRPNVRLYFLPLQLHPLHSPWHYGTPGGFIKESWQTAPFLTVGWPQDTTGLEDGCIRDEQFLDLCDSIDRSREAVLLHHLKSFREGLIGIVFDTLDRVQHMFWRDRPDIVDEWYVKLDGLVSRVEAQLNAVSAKEPARFVVASDHGFARFDYKSNLNRWMLEHGYLVSNNGDRAGKMQDIDWGKTQAYAIGLNSLYLNLAGREGKGIVEKAAQEQLEYRLQDQLLQWHTPNGERIVNKVWRRAEIFDGNLSEYAPDLVIGYAPGYRASQETGLGQWTAHSLEPNPDHWSADHCIDATSVPGVLFANTGLTDFPNPTYRDIPALTISGAPDPTRGSAPQPYTEEDQEIVEERLRSLGYL